MFVCALGLYPSTPGWGVRCGCVCWVSGFRCAQALLAGVLGCVCVCVRALLVPCYCWLGHALWVCVLGLGSQLRSATRGWGVEVCVCLCARSACTPPLLAVVCGVGVCACTQVSAAPRHSWLGCWGGCVGVHPLLVPRHSWLGFVGCGLGVAWHLFLCRGSLRDVRAARVSGTRWPLLLGTCPCALVVAGGVPLWRVWWPRAGLPLLVRSGRSRCSGRLSRRRGAFSTPGAIYWAASPGKWRLAENRALCACRWPLPRQRRWACSVSYVFGAVQ